MEKKINTQLRIDSQMHEKAKVIAACELRSVNNQYEYFIVKGIELYEKENGMISVSLREDQSR